MSLIPKVKLPRVALQRSTLQTPKTPKFVKPKNGKRYVAIGMLGVFLTLLDKWGRPQSGKPSIPSRRPMTVHLLPWLYHGNSYWRDRANQNLPKVQERTLRHRSNELCRAVWRPHWPFMQKHLVRPQFATGFQQVPFGRRTTNLDGKKMLANPVERKKSNRTTVLNQLNHWIHLTKVRSRNENFVREEGRPHELSCGYSRTCAIFFAPRPRAFTKIAIFVFQNVPITDYVKNRSGEKAREKIKKKCERGDHF